MRRDNPATLPFLAGGGRLAELIADFHWDITPIGPIADWPGAHEIGHRAHVALARADRHAVGRIEGVMIYNDAYAEFAGSRHPSLLGSNVREGWPEVAEFNDNVMKEGLAGRTLSYVDQELTLSRDGTPKQAWLNLDYSPAARRAGRCPRGHGHRGRDHRQGAGRAASARRTRAARPVVRPGAQLHGHAVGPRTRFRTGQSCVPAAGRTSAVAGTDGRAGPAGCGRAGLPRVARPGLRDRRDLCRSRRQVRRAGGCRTVLCRNGLSTSCSSPSAMPRVRCPASLSKASMSPRVSPRRMRRQASDARLGMVIEGAKDHAILATDAIGPRHRLVRWRRSDLRMAGRGNRRAIPLMSCSHRRIARAACRPRSFSPLSAKAAPTTSAGICARTEVGSS